MKKVQVLLSSYNGEMYLREQIESILLQDYPQINILIRDDGSVDNTVELLKSYANRYDRIQYYEGKNIGAMNSFYDLIENIDQSADYYSLSDQDDFWESNKISKAIIQLEEYQNKSSNKVPLLYCSSVTVVDENLQIINLNPKKHNTEPAFGNALLENICVGCTIIMNKELRDIVVEHIPIHSIMHDWWIYIIASCYGKIIYDNESSILYRQHEKNAIGTSINNFDRIMRRIKNYKRNKGAIMKQVKEFEAIYKLDNNYKAQLKHMIEYKININYRLEMVFSKEIFRQDKVDNLIFKIMFLIGQI